MQGFIEVVIVVAIVLGAIFVSNIQFTSMGDWTVKCNTDGGKIQRTNFSEFNPAYECYKDGKIIDHVN